MRIDGDRSRLDGQLLIRLVLTCQSGNCRLSRPDGESGLFSSDTISTRLTSRTSSASCHELKANLEVLLYAMEVSLRILEALPPKYCSRACPV